MMRSCNNRANSSRNYQTNHYKCQSLSISPGDKEGGLLVLVLLLLRHLSFRQYGLLPPAKEVLCLSVHLCEDISLLSLSFKGRNILIIKSKPALWKCRRSIKVLLLHHCSSWLFPPPAPEQIKKIEHFVQVYLALCDHQLHHNVSHDFCHQHFHQNEYLCASLSSSWSCSVTDLKNLFV